MAASSFLTTIQAMPENRSFLKAKIIIVKFKGFIRDSLIHCIFSA